jgi:hypothetical protein
MRTFPVLLAFLGSASAAFAQSFNVDVNAFVGTPPNTYGAAGQVGTWNIVPPTPASTPLVDISGGATGVTLGMTGTGAAFNFDNVGTTGNDQLLMDDLSDHGSGALGATWTFSGLAAGNYTLITYAWAPDSAAFRSRVTVAGSSSPFQDVGGAWPGGFATPTTHAVHNISVGAGGSIAATIAIAPGGGFASCNGFQLTRLSDAFVQNCVPGQDGVIACPCANPPVPPGLGCNNFGTGPVESGILNGTGTPSLSADTVSLTASGLNNTFTTVFFTGEGVLSTGTVNGAGVRCVDTNLKRLYTGPAPAATITKPGGGDPTVSAATAALGAPITAGQTRHYFVVYRDPNAAAPCGNTSSTVNLTNSGSLTWFP